MRKKLFISSSSKAFPLLLVILGTLLLTLLFYHQLPQMQQAATPSSPTPSCTSSGALPWLKTSGNKIVDADNGQEVILRGANIMNSEWHGNMNWEEKAIPELANNWKGNVLVRGFAADPVNNKDIHYLSMLDEYVSLTANNHMYIVFSWRSYTINGPQPSMPDLRAKRALAALAARYKEKSNVIYSLQVEPHDVDWATLRPKFENMVDAIRQAASPYIPLIMIPGTDWSGDLSQVVTNPIKRPNVVYNSHPYSSSQAFEKLFGTAYDAGLPVFIGEFGPWGGMKMNDVNALLSFTRQRHIGWAAWDFDFDTDPLIEHNFTPTSPYGTTIKAEMMTTPTLTCISR